VVCLSVGRSVRLSVTTVSPAKTAEPIGMSFGMWTQVVPRTVLQIPNVRGNFEGKEAAHSKV